MQIIERGRKKKLVNAYLGLIFTVGREFYEFFDYKKVFMKYLRHDKENEKRMKRYTKNIYYS